MQNRETNKQQADREEDLFYGYFRDHLKDHQMPVDDFDWELVEERIKPKPKGKVGFLWYASAAAMILLALCLRFAPSSPEKTVLLTKRQKPVQRVEEDASSPTRTTKKVTIKTVWLAQVAHSDSVHSLDGVVDVCTNDTTKIRFVEVSKEAEAGVDTGSVVVKKKQLDRPMEGWIAYEPKAHSTWEISSAIGTSAMNSAPKLYSNDMYLLASSIEIPRSEFGVNDYSEVVAFSPPLTFGLLARKRLNSIFRIETGLTYSFLSTTFEDNSSRYDARLSLHYIGIPLNLSADVWNLGKRLTFYASAGVMAEKGIKSVLTERYHEPQRSVTYQGGISGLQWSFCASVGLSYRLYDHWSLYLEPHASYYLDNQQPTSIRTVRQTLAGLNTGFRFDF